MTHSSLEQIRKYWTKQALMFKQSPVASWSDHSVIDIENREILKYLNQHEKILDVGCANGYSTFQLAAVKQIIITGVDYIPEMIKFARQRLRSLKTELESKVTFREGDVTSLEDRENSYDKVIVKRVLINLGSWPRQKKGLQECTRVLKSGGMLLLSEATLQGWSSINRFRREWKLPDIPMPSFNLYLDEEKVMKEVSSQLTLIELVNFSSTYYIGTRVLKPLLIKALGIDIDVKDPNMEWNRWFSQLPAWGDYGTQKLFIFRKK